MSTNKTKDINTYFTLFTWDGMGKLTCIDGLSAVTFKMTFFPVDVLTFE